MIEYGKEVLRDCEGRLRELVSEAAAAGEYEAVIQLTEWARTVSALASGTTQTVRKNTGVAETAKRKKSKRKPSSAGKSRRTAAASYPRFARLKNDLVKIGWSKKEKKEYSHKAPYSAIRALVAAMANVGRDGRVFSTDELLPLDDAEGNTFPGYQVYACIALLKRKGLIDQHGRQGYSILQPDSLDHEVEAIWRELPEHRPPSEAKE